MVDIVGRNKMDMSFVRLLHLLAHHPDFKQAPGTLEMFSE
jgi:hypothetical protein